MSQKKAQKQRATFTFKQQQEINIDGAVFRFSSWQDI